MGQELVPVRRAELVVHQQEEAPPPPAIVQAAGGAAQFAWDEFFSGEVRNLHTRTAYLRNVRRFLACWEKKKVELARITPGMVGRYLDELEASPATKNLISLPQRLMATYSAAKRWRISSNGPLFRRDDSLRHRAAHW